MFHLHRSSDNQFYFTLRARNGRVLMTSETYSTKAMAKKGIGSVLVAAIKGNKHKTVDHAADKIKRPRFLQPTLNLTTERLVNGKLKPVRVTAGKNKGK
jgi:uncharacterized protein YegP (UPF0339 family)